MAPALMENVYIYRLPHNRFIICFLAMFISLSYNFYVYSSHFMRLILYLFLVFLRLYNSVLILEKMFGKVSILMELLLVLVGCFFLYS